LLPPAAALALLLDPPWGCGLTSQLLLPQVSTETLLEFALDNPELQFIFLTPQVGRLGGCALRRAARCRGLALQLACCAAPAGRRAAAP
jgi:hypothetical protein